MEKIRCYWCPPDKPLYCEYHDAEWGVQVHNDRLLFEMLILEGTQARLSWWTILQRRETYRKDFADFDVPKVARFDAKKKAALMKDEGIVRNSAKISATVDNAGAFLAVQKNSARSTNTSGRSSAANQSGITARKAKSCQRKLPRLRP